MNHTTRPLSQMQSHTIGTHTTGTQRCITCSFDCDDALTSAMSLLVHITISLDAGDILMMACHMLQHWRGEDSDANGV